MADQVISQDGTYALDIVQGKPVDLELTYEQPVGESGNQWEPIPRPGWSGRAQVRDSPGGKLLLTLTVIVSQTTDGDDVGKIWVRATSAQTKDLRRGGVWDLELYDGSGNEDPIISLSPVTLTRQVTTP